jgi:tRNA pseudouridine38-40 synthase
MAAVGMNDGMRVRRNIKLTVAYDGSGYHGFQRQLNARTVQQVLEDKLSGILGGPLAVAGAARTDTGVHAYGQVISVLTGGAIPTERIPAAARGVLPQDIAVLDAMEMPAEFHARFSATGKVYVYRVLNSEKPDPILKNYVWQIERALDVEKMNQALQFLVGEHHFGAFQASGSSARNPVRTLYAAGCIRQESTVEFRFHGNGFLYHMVRNIVGTVVDLGVGKLSQDDFEKIIAGRNRKAAGATAPPTGLYLKEVLYEKP